MTVAPVVSAAARDLHAGALVVDGHNDLPDRLRNDERDLRQPQPQWHTDLERLRLGGVGAQFWAAFVPTQAIAERRCARHALEQIDLIHRTIRRYPDALGLATTADGIVAEHRANRVASLIGVEGGHAIENSLGVLRVFHQLGARYLTLTHVDTIDWVDAATDAPRHGGLTAFGEDVIRELNRLGMMTDISHVSADAMRAVLRVSAAPVIASHSNADAIAHHPRNLPDDVLRGIARSGGIAMVNFSTAFVSPAAAEVLFDIFDVLRDLQQRHPDPAGFEAASEAWRASHPFPRGTLEDVADHIDHIVEVAGIDHVGLGSDFDGVASTPEYLDSVADFPRITQVLIDRGYDDNAILQILGANLLRVMRDTAAAAQR